MTSQRITTSYLNSELMECSSSLKSNKVIKFANKLNSYKLVSKKFGDVKKFHCLSEASLKFLVGELFAY